MICFHCHSFTRVSCERAFSKLKLIETRLRSSLSDEKLETFMLMNIESDNLDGITDDDSITVVTSVSETIRKPPLVKACIKNKKINKRRKTIFNMAYGIHPAMWLVALKS